MRRYKRRFNESTRTEADEATDIVIGEIASYNIEGLAKEIMQSAEKLRKDLAKENNLEYESDLVYRFIDDIEDIIRELNARSKKLCQEVKDVFEDHMVI